MFTEPSRRGRTPTILSADEERAFRNRFSKVVHPRRGVLIYDKLTNTWIALSRFERDYGIRGKQFLDRAEPYRSLEHYAAVYERATGEAPVPEKNPYRAPRREGVEP